MRLATQIFILTGLSQHTFSSKLVSQHLAIIMKLRPLNYKEEETMKEVAEILGRLIAVLVIKGILTQTDKAFVLGNITEAEWIEKEDET